MRLPLTADALLKTPKGYASAAIPTNPELDLDEVAAAASDAARIRSKHQHRAAMDDARYTRAKGH